MDSLNFQMVDNTLDGIDGYHSDEGDYSVVGRGSPPNSPQHNDNTSQGRTDIAKINEYLRKLDEEFDKRDEDELSRKDQLELLKTRETIDLEINDGIESLSTILKIEDLNDLLKETAQAAKEKIIVATETASSGETTLKRPIELLTEIIPVFCTACNNSCEQLKSDDTAKAEFVKYEAAIEKIKACEDVEERNECIKVAKENLGKCIELAKQDVDRITEKRNMEEIEGRSASFEETKVKVDNIVQAELNDTKRWVNNCEHDGTILSQWLKEVEEEHTSATNSFEKTKKNIKYKINKIKLEQEDLKRKLKACEAKEISLKVTLQEEELQQDEAKESYRKFCGKVIIREKNVSGIQKRAKTSSKVMTYMEDPLGPEIFDVIYQRVCDWRRLGHLLGLEVHELNNIEIDYAKKEDRVERCILLKKESEANPLQWSYLKDILLRMDERDLVMDIERKQADLLQDEHINVSHVDPLGPEILDMIYQRVCNWRRLGRLIGLEDYELNNIEIANAKKEDKVERCISCKNDIEANPVDWFYLRNILLNMEEEDLVEDIEFLYPNLLDDKRIDLSDVDLSSAPFKFALDMICERVSNLERFAKVLHVKYLLRDLLENEKYIVQDINEKIAKCIDEKTQTSKEELDWFYWRNILSQMDEGELIEDIEERFPCLLQDKRIDISDAAHQVVNEFGILAHDASNGDLFHKIPTAMKDKIKISIGAGNIKMYSVNKIPTIQDIDFKNLFLEKIQLFDFSNISRNEECKVLKNVYTWLKNNDDDGFCIKGYDAKEHLEFLSEGYFNDKPYNGSYILVYSKKHNVILNIDTNPDDIKKSMRENRSNIRYLCTSNQCIDNSSFVYIPVTPYDPNKHKVDDPLICKMCTDLELVVTLDKFESIELFNKWWENISNTVEDMKCELDEKVDISNDFFKSIMTFMAFDSFNLPSFTKNQENEIKEARKLIMLTPEQQDIVYSASRYKIIKGPSGTGKTVVTQKILKLVANVSKDDELVYYILHDTESVFVKEMKNIASSLKSNNVKCCKRSDLVKDDRLLSTILQNLLEFNKDKKIHVFIEEFNVEILNASEIQKVKTILENKEFKNSHIVIVAQSMENERFETNDEFKTLLYETYQHEKLTEETDFKIFQLSHLLKSSLHINDIVNAAIPILEKAKMKYTIPKLDISATTSSVQGSLNLKPPAPFDRTPETSPQPKIRRTNELLSDNSIDNTCKFLKKCSMLLYNGDMIRQIESSYSFVGDRESAHNVEGKKPVIYYPFRFKKQSLARQKKLFSSFYPDEKQSYFRQFCLSKVIQTIFKEKKKVVIICLNIDSMDIIKDALMVNEIKWTNNPELLSTEVCVLTDYTTVSGCAFLNVVIVCPTNEQYLKHNLINSISRCILYLKVIVLNLDTPDAPSEDTLVAVLNEWENKNLVIVNNQDYLINVTWEELSKFAENNHDLFLTQNLQPSVHEQRAGFVSNLYSKSQQTTNNDTTGTVEAPESFVVFQDIWETCKKASRCNDVILLFDALKEKHLNINTIYVCEEDIAYGSLLHYAVCRADTDIVKFLILLDVDVNATDSDGRTPLHVAVSIDNIDIIQLLLREDKTDLNLSDNYGESSLKLATNNNSLCVLKLLLQQDNIDVNVTNKDGRTTLHSAAYNNNIDIVKLLLEVDDIDVNVSDIYGKTPLQLATSSSNIDIVQLLLQQIDIDVNKSDNFGLIPLHWAVIKNNINIIKLLLQVEYIDISVADNDGSTPFDLATRYKHDHIKQILDAASIDTTANEDYTNEISLAAETVLSKDTLNEPKVFDVIANRITNWKRFGRIIGIEEHNLNNIENDYNSKYERAYQCILHKKEISESSIEWPFWRESLLRMEEGVIVDIIEIKYPVLSVKNEGEGIDKTSSQKFKWRKFGRLIGTLEDVLNEIGYVYKNNYERVYHCIRNSSIDKKIINWQNWKETLQTFSEGGEIVDIIEIQFMSELNLTYKNQVHICVHKLADLAIIAHNASIEDNFSFLPFELTQKSLPENNTDIYRFCNDESTVNCNILKTLNIWLKKNNDAGFAIKGYDVKNHLKSVTVGYNDETPYKDSYVLLYSAKHNTIINIDTDPTTNINAAVRNNRTNIRYLRTLHQCLNVNFLVYVPVVLYDIDKNQSQTACENCKGLQLAISKYDFDQLNTFEKWWENMEIHLGEIIKSIREPRQIMNITDKFLSGINSFMYSLHNNK